MFVSPACIYGEHMCSFSHGDQKSMSDHGCELTGECWEMNQDHLQEQKLFLIAELPYACILQIYISSLLIVITYTLKQQFLYSCFQNKHPLFPLGKVLQRLTVYNRIQLVSRRLYFSILILPEWRSPHFPD